MNTEERRRAIRTPRVIASIAVLVAVIALIFGVIFPTATPIDPSTTLTYDNLSPYLSGYLKKSEITNNYTTTTALSTLLANKQDSLPTCEDQETLTYDLPTSSWGCSPIAPPNTGPAVDLSAYYTKTATNAQISASIAASLSNFATTSYLHSLLASKADQTALNTTNTNLSTTNSALATETTDRTTADTSLGARLSTLETAGYLTSGDLSSYATESWVLGQNYVTQADIDSSLATYTTTTLTPAITSATSDMATNSAIASTYVAKADLSCDTNKALIGTGTNGTISCRSIEHITAGTLTASDSLITSSTLATVLGNYYTKSEVYNKTELNTRLQNMAEGADGPLIFKVVTVMPSPANQAPNTVYLLTRTNP